MTAVVGRRLLEAVITLLMFSVLVFAATHVLGDPTVSILGPDSTVEARDELRRQLGLDQPIVQQYFDFLTSTLQGDLGDSTHTQVPVWESIKDRAPSSLLLAVTAMLAALMIAIPLGVVAATRKGQVADGLARSTALIGQGTPSFLLAMLAVWLFAIKLGWFPAGGQAGVKSLSSRRSCSPVYRRRRAPPAALQPDRGAQGDFVLLRRSLGLPNRKMIWVWALPNAMISVIAFIGYMFGIIIAGAIVVEAVFVWPGLGSLAYEAILTA